jgi:hypothetical protein
MTQCFHAFSCFHSRRGSMGEGGGRNYPSLPPRKQKTKKISNYNTHENDFKTHECISTCRVWFIHAEVRFLHAECNIYTQCDFDRPGWDFNTHKIYFCMQSKISTRKEWFYHQSMASTYTKISKTHMRVNMTLTSVISTRSSVIFTCRV